MMVTMEMTLFQATDHTNKTHKNQSVELLLLHYIHLMAFFQGQPG